MEPPPRCDAATVGCFKVFCEGTSNVYVKLEDEWKFCDYSATSEATVYFADAAISIVCPDPAQICPSFATLTGPHIKVYDMPAPADPNQLSSPSNLITIESASLKVNVETSVVRIGSGGVRMDVAVDGKVLRSYAEGWGVDPETGRIRLRYEYEIVGLPATPTTGKMLEFRLVDQYGRTLDTEVFHVHIKHTDIAQGVLSDVTGSTEYEPFDANSGVTRWPFVGVSEPDYPTIEPSAPGMAQPTTDTTDAPENGASWAPQHAGGRVLTAEETGSEEPSWLSNQFVFEEFLVVKLSNPVIPREIRLYENRSPGSLTRIEALTGPEGAVSTVMWERERPRRTEMTVQAATDPAITAQSFPLRVPSDATNLRTDTLRLTWGLKYTSWPEVAAVGVYGDAAELPRVVSLTEAAYGGLPTEAVLGVGEKTTVVVTFRLETASTLFWETPEFLVATRRHCSPATGVCTETVEELTWGRVLTQEGVVFGPADINVAVEIDTGAMGRTELREWMSGGVSGSVVLYNALFARNAQPTGTPAYGEVVATRRHTDGITLRGPPCRHGVPIRDGPLDSGWCKCFAGAYGPTCEFLECPNNCSDDGVYAAGVCDRWTGTCKCALGRIGSDCSGTLGQCVLSYDGSCPPGTAKGSYLFNTEDDNNMNRAFGTVPESMICDGTAPGSINAFGCPERVSIDMCCQPTELPSCPFAENAPPCSSPACPIAGGTLSIDTLTEDLVADPSGGWRAPACLEVVNAYCFWHPEDAACHTFARPYVAEDPCFATPQDPTCASYTRPPTPVEFACPRHLAIRHCAADLDRPGCREFIALRSCGFPSGVCAACRDAQGVPDYRSEGCRNAIISHCTASRSDPECDLHGFGNDGCLFQAGSAPCNSLACRPEFYQRGECLAVVDGHCRSTPTDPQCLALGYGDTTSAVASYARPANESTCPWGLIQQECLLAPADPYCVTLAQIGLVQPAGPIPVGTASAPVPRAFAPPQEPESAAEAAEEVAARTALKRSTLDVEMERQQEATRQALFREIFEWADGNGDNRLVASEVAVARNMIRSFRMSGVPMPLSRGVLSALEESGVLDSLTPWYLGVDGATDGNHLTRDQFLLQMEVLFQDWTARNGSAYE